MCVCKKSTVMHARAKGSRIIKDFSPLPEDFNLPTDNNEPIIVSEITVERLSESLKLMVQINSPGGFSSASFIFWHLQSLIY